MHNIFFCGKRADRSCHLVMNNVNDLKSFSGIPSIGIYRERGRTVSTTIYHLVIQEMLRDQRLPSRFVLLHAISSSSFWLQLLAVARKKKIVECCASSASILTAIIPPRGVCALPHLLISLFFTRRRAVSFIKRVQTLQQQSIF